MLPAVDHMRAFTWRMYKGADSSCSCNSLQEGLDTISVTRHVSVISITLSTVPLDPGSPGYQPPLPTEMVKTHLSPAPHLGPMTGGGCDISAAPRTSSVLLDMPMATQCNWTGQHARLCTLTRKSCMQGHLEPGGRRAVQWQHHESGQCWCHWQRCQQWPAQ